MKKISILILVIIGVSIGATALAHCPLCTVGAGAAALGASWLGVGNAAIGVFIGAFAIALGLWMGRIISKQYIPLQKYVVGVLSFVLTVIPLLPLMQGQASFYLYLRGDYGSLLNRTYAWNTFLIGAVIGALIVVAAPYISSWVSKIKGKSIPYQGLSINFSLLLLTALIFELWT